MNVKNHQAAHVVVADGHANDRKAILACVSAPAYDVTECDSAAAVHEAIAADLPDLVIAEVRLPDASGYSLCRKIREDPRTSELSVMLISKWATEFDRIIAFESGADDFVARPFSRRELSSRVAAQLRRRNGRREGRGDTSIALDREPIGGEGPPVLRRFDTSNLAAEFGNLTSTEASILAALIEMDGRPLSREKIIDRIWSKHNRPSERCVDSHVKSLRFKMTDAPGRIETVRGFGYRFATKASG